MPGSGSGGVVPAGGRQIPVRLFRPGTDNMPMSGMTKRINPQDNIFILNSRLKLLRDTLILDTDPVLFMDKTIDDTEFLDRALETMLEYLRANDCLFGRDEVLDYLSDLEWDFSRFLADLSGGPGNISAVPYPVLQERIRLLRERGSERLKAIGENRKAAAFSPVESAVSSDERNELLKDF
jgi:hypothetical protein